MATASNSPPHAVFDHFWPFIFAKYMIIIHKLNLIFVCWQKNERSLQDGDCRTSYPGVSLVRGNQLSCDI